ncbi:YlbF family regulator [Lachnospiraceae bacterium ZAX-1]
MNQVDSSIEQLIDAVKNSEEYKAYQKVKARLSKEPDKERALHQFRKKNYILQSKGNKADLFEEVDFLSWDFEELRVQPTVEEYLAAELAFCRMVQDINRKFSGSLDFDLGFVLEM